MKNTLLLICILFTLFFLNGELNAQRNYCVLFVGNSLTYVNDLPTLVKEEAKRQNLTVTTDLLAFANYALEDHWNEGVLQQKIKTGKFDFVVVQQGPSSQQDGKEMLLTYGKLTADLCKKYDTKLAFYMVWPSRSYYLTFEGVIQNYTGASRACNAILCPVGEVWKEHFDTTQDFSYYGPDSFHPSLKGSKVAAEVIVKSLFFGE